MKFDASEAPKERVSYVKRDFGYFAQVPIKLADDRRVRDKAVRLFIIYFSYTNFENPSKPFRVNQSKVAARLGCKSKLVSDLTGELHNTGWITIKRTGRSNIITLHGKPKRR